MSELRASRTSTVALVASGGGHLHELVAIADRVTPVGWQRVWLVPSSGNGVGSGPDQVVQVPDPGPRDLKAATRAAAVLQGILRRLRPDAVVSTGAAVAVPALSVATALRIEGHYVESAARVDGPSLTGRLVERLPGMYCYAQWHDWLSRRWPVPGCVFDGYRAAPGSPRPIRRVVVMLGTQRSFGFRRAVERLLPLLGPDADVLWQVGSTDVRGLPVTGQRYVPAQDLERALRECDLVVAHAGVGSALAALAAGKCPLLIPRERAYGEHVDDHQTQIGGAVGARGLAVVCRANLLTSEHLARAASSSVTTSPVPPLDLRGRLGSALWRTSGGDATARDGAQGS